MHCNLQLYSTDVSDYEVQVWSRAGLFKDSERVALRYSSSIVAGFIVLSA